MNTDALFAAAKSVREAAYAPYSSFKVGAALVDEQGRVFAAANVENVAYPQSQCAEANAIGMLIAAGGRRIDEVLVVGDGPLMIAPCGGCRQRLAEFATPETPVHLADLDAVRKTVTMAELLPHGFAPAHLSAAPPTGSPVDAGAKLRSMRHGGEIKIAIQLGSGLGSFADFLEDPDRLSYAELAGFPKPGVAGHAGEAVTGRVAGVPILCLNGRVHLYEGLPVSAVNPMIRALKDAGIELVILTNASGGIRDDLAPGDVVRLTDHINALGSNPLTGPNDDRIGPRFVDMGEVYCPSLGAVVDAAAARVGQRLPLGVYLATPGPSFETPAEIRAFRALGADLVGMSTVPEAISARHAGLRVLGLSVVTNRAAGLSNETLSHEQTLAAGAAASDGFAALLTQALPDLAHEL